VCAERDCYRGDACEYGYEKKQPGYIRQTQHANLLSHNGICVDVINKDMFALATLASIFSNRARWQRVLQNTLVLSPMPNIEECSERRKLTDWLRAYEIYAETPSNDSNPNGSAIRQSTQLCCVLPVVVVVVVVLEAVVVTVVVIELVDVTLGSAGRAEAVVCTKK
ncbi:hypothetical protein FOZ62_010609, partial [Perkinsus olseni]